MAAIDIVELFTRLGHVGGVGYALAGRQAELVDMLASVWDEYKDTTDLDLIGTQTQIEKSTISAAQAPMDSLSGLASPTLTRMVGDSVPALKNDPQSCMTELIRQMGVASATVPACTVTAPSAALSTNVGDGVLVITTKRGDGLQQDNIVAESLRLSCTADSYTGGATEGSEQFLLAGNSNTAGTWDYDWPLGSGQAVSAVAVSASTDGNLSGNLLTNGDFEDWSDDAAPELDDWQISGAVWGTSIMQDATGYQGDFAVEFVAGLGANQILFQEFGEDTAATPQPLNSYIVNFFARKVSGTITAGILTVELTDAAGAVINDEQGVANSATFDLTTLTTGYAAKNAVFRVPNAPPDEMRIRFRVSTALVGGNVLIDDACFAAVTAAYPGGFGFVVFSGATPFVKNDGWDVTPTNDRAGQLYGATWQTLFDRLFGMRGLNQLLPTGATPTLPDSMITWPGILAYYRFQNDLTDSSGQQKTLTGSSDTYAAGVVGQCLDTGSGTLNYPVPSIVDRSRSLSVWFFGETGPSAGGILSTGAKVGWEFFAVQYMADDNTFRIGWLVDGLTFSTGGTADAVQGAWNHVVLTYDHTTSTGNLWVNGTLEHSQSAAASGSGDFTLTVETNAGGGGLTSALDEFLAFDGVLSAEQIRQLYNAGAGFDPTS